MFGISSTAIDPLIPLISKSFEKGYDKIGLALLGGSIFSLIATFITGKLCDKLNIKKIIIASIIMLAAGFALFGFFPYYFAFVFVIIILKSGYGAMDSSVHVLASRIYPDNHSLAFIRLDIFWYVGALIGPLLISMTLLFNIDPRYAFFLFSAVFLLLLILFRNVKNQPLKEEVCPLGKTSFLSNKVIILCSMVLFFMTGSIIGISTWLTTYFTVFDVPVAFGSLILSGFWLFSLVGLLIINKIIKRSNELTILFFGSFLAIIAIIALLLTNNLALKIVIVGLLALFLSGSFSLAISISAYETKKQMGSAIGLNIAFALSGSILFQPLLGFFAEYVGKDSIIYLLAAGLFCGFICIATLLWILHKKYGTKLMYDLNRIR